MAAGRPLQFDPDAALEAAMETFWTKGFDATSMHDLLRATRLSRSSLYQTFGSKHRLFELCIKFYRDSLTNRMRDTLDASASGIEFLRAVLQTVSDEAVRGSRRRGCLVLNTAREFHCRDRGIADLVKGSTEQMAAIFQAAIERAQREGDIDAGRDSRALARFFLSSISGLRTMVQARAERKTVEEIAAIVIQALR